MHSSAATSLSAWAGNDTSPINQIATVGTIYTSKHALPNSHRDERRPAGVRERTATCVELATGLPVPIGICNPAVSLLDTLQGATALTGAE